jgi:hypothetical protein
MNIHFSHLPFGEQSERYRFDDYIGDNNDAVYIVRFLFQYHGLTILHVFFILWSSLQRVYICCYSSVISLTSLFVQQFIDTMSTY